MIITGTKAEVLADLQGLIPSTASPLEIARTTGWPTQQIYKFWTGPASDVDTWHQILHDDFAVCLQGVDDTTNITVEIDEAS